MADKYLYSPQGGGQPHGYFDGKYVYSMKGECLYYQDGNYLFAMKGGKAVAYQDGNYFFAADGGKPLWYIPE